MSNASNANAAHGLSIHRSDALADGVFAVAMTLLVIDLKLPEHRLVHTADDLARALASLLPKAISWFISFGVLVFFWFGHQRTFRRRWWANTAARCCRRSSIR